MSPHFSTPPSSPREVDFFQYDLKQNNFQEENVLKQSLSNEKERFNSNYENVEIRTSDEEYRKCSGSPYENVMLQQNSNGTTFHQSPRTRIKTILTTSREK